MDQLQQHALKSIAMKLEGQLDIKKVQEHVKEDDSWHQVSQRMDCKKVSGDMEVYSQRQMKHLKSDRSLLSAQGSAAGVGTTPPTAMETQTEGRWHFPMAEGAGGVPS